MDIMEQIWFLLTYTLNVQAKWKGDGWLPLAKSLCVICILGHQKRGLQASQGKGAAIITKYTQSLIIRNGAKSH